MIKVWFKDSAEVEFFDADDWTNDAQDMFILLMKGEEEVALLNPVEIIWLKREI